jgi:hypothetical protein
MFSYPIGKLGSSVGTVIVRKIRALRVQQKNLQKLDTMQLEGRCSGIRSPNVKGILWTDL